MEIHERGVTGRGECVPYVRYGENMRTVLDQIEALRAELCAGLTRGELQETLPPGAARNALDCALWDLEAKLTGTPAWKLANLSEPQPLETTYTLSLDTPANMARMARAHTDKPLLKLKLGAHGASERVHAVRTHAPGARIIVDANEAWSFDQLQRLLPQLAELGVELVEQPLPAKQDRILEGFQRTVPLCADESFHHSGDIETIKSRYDIVNIKLDKTGGLTEAIQCHRAALAMGLKIMIGSMIGTSLAMAPATLLAPGAYVVDLDSPLLLSRDREHGLIYKDGKLEPPSPNLWG